MSGHLHSMSEIARELGTYVDKVKFCAAACGVELTPAGTAFVVDDAGAAKIKAQFKKMPRLRAKRTTNK